MMHKEKEVVLITGANGLVARSLAQNLHEKYEVRFLTRKPVSRNEFHWNVEKGEMDACALKGVTHIIHLAGAGVGDKRWSKKRKEEILASRVNSTRLLLETLKREGISIVSFIAASAVGYYGTIPSEGGVDESSSPGANFLSHVCLEWERASLDYSGLGLFQKHIILRLGVVLSRQGGALPKMLTPIKYHLGAILGWGSQFMPWIHIADLCAVIAAAVEGRLKSGTYNAVAPEHVSNEEFTRLLAAVYGKRIFLPPIPGWFVKLLYGEASLLLLEGVPVSSQKLRDAGYSFQFPELRAALLDLKA
ncbi:MAG: TIGR01777 family protein [Bacteroidetes bacterium]|nr:MAG: TIGR01777 family protein [Bacteroidota bacterium]